MPHALRQLGKSLPIALFLTLGCSDQEMESMRLAGAKAISKAKSLTEEAGEKLRMSLPPGRGGAGLAGESEVSRRVQYRLHYDRVLEGAEIDVRPGNDAVVLHGRIRSETQRRRAIEIAETTAGVEKVIDDLSTAAK